MPRLAYLNGWVPRSRKTIGIPRSVATAGEVAHAIALFGGTLGARAFVQPCSSIDQSNAERPEMADMSVGDQSHRRGEAHGKETTSAGEEAVIPFRWGVRP